MGRLRSLGGGDLAQGSVVVGAQPLSPHARWGGNYLELFTPAIQALPGPAGENQLESLVRARETGAVWPSAGWSGGRGATQAGLFRSVSQGTVAALLDAVCALPIPSCDQERGYTQVR